MAISNINELIIRGDNLLLEGIPKAIDKKILAYLLEVIAKHQKNGVLMIPNDVLATIEEDLYSTIKDSDYSKVINAYMQLFDAADTIISKEQSEINNLKASNIEQLWKGSNNREMFISKVVYDLGQQGMKDVFIKGLANIVRDANFVNMTIEQAASKLSEVIVDNDYTARYVRSTAIDALAQYDGAINNEVRTVYGFGNYGYIGNTIETSRPICIHLRDDLGGRFDEKTLKQVLSEYCPEGIPSEKKIVIDDKSIKKGSGMIEGTNMENFMQLRGGYGCRHRCLSIR